MSQDLSTDESPWGRLRRHTSARIGLARTGTSITTKAHLSFLSAHAQARTAIYDTLDAMSLKEGLSALGLDSILLHSAADDRRSYLLRPDLGRKLATRSRAQLLSVAPGSCDLAFVVGDGLSSRAVQTHVLPLLDAMLPELRRLEWVIGRVAIVEQARVAIGDEIGAALSASVVVVLIGERPGLTSPDSLGAYLTWAPRIGCSDAERNCVSNIRPEGLSYPQAAAKILYLLTQARLRQMTGVMLKDEMPTEYQLAPRRASLLSDY